jgi:hypothetical protein
MKMQMEHRKRLQQIPSSIDNKPPQIFKHLEFKPKTVQIKEGKFHFYNLFAIGRVEMYSLIEKNNKKLMDKMALIIHNKETFCKFRFMCLNLIFRITQSCRVLVCVALRPLLWERK